MTESDWASCQQEKCTAEFLVTASTSPTKKYCSGQCREQQKRNVALRVLRHCARQECGIEYRSKHPDSKYCSRSCSARVANQSDKRRSRAKRACAQCGVITANPKFCSSVCSNEFQRSQTDALIASWLVGEIAMSAKNGQLRDMAKAFLQKRAGYKCTECGWGEVNPSSGKVPLCVDHIDGDWRNNFISNLRVLCFNCHTLTPTFGALNIS